jgi:hypothetical protein
MVELPKDKLSVSSAFLLYKAKGGGISAYQSDVSKQ